MIFKKSAVKKLSIKLVVFLGLFVAVTGVIGSWLVPTRLLYGFNFYIYGNLGKMVILSAVMLVLMAKNRLRMIDDSQWKKSNIIFLIDAGIFCLLFFYLAGLLLDTSSFYSNLPLSLATHLVLIAIPLLLLMGVFGFSFLTKFIKQFSGELIICTTLSVIFTLGIFQFWKLWPFFSGGVLRSVEFLLSLSFSDVRHILPLTLEVEDFSVAILQACSGIDSFFMLTALYAFIGLVDCKRLNIVKFLLVYPVAVGGMYLVNIFRVYLLIVVGVTISPELAVNLFHTYAGMIMFIFYFGLFWKVAYRSVVKTNNDK